MSAVLTDELVVARPATLRVVRAADPVVPAAVRPAGPEASQTATAARTAGAQGSLRLTDRGIAVLLFLFVGLFVAGVAVAIGAFLAVSDAPIAGDGAAAVAAGR